MESQKRTHHGKLKPLANSFGLVHREIKNYYAVRLSLTLTYD